MAILNTGLAKTSAEAYDIPYSCRFEDDGDSSGASLSRTPSSNGNRKTWVWSAWVKRGNIERGFLWNSVIDGDTGGAFSFGFSSSDTLTISDWNAPQLETSAKYRDPSAWMHIVLAWDTTQTTESNRAQLYVNGSLVVLNELSHGGWSGYPPEDDERSINATQLQTIGSPESYATDRDYFDGYLAEVHFFDGDSFFSDDSGTANTGFNVNSFGETGDYGEWKPKAYDGDAAYGTNGFYLDFADAADLGDDESGEGNDFTENNLTAYDQMLDSPTNNFCVMNPLDVMTNDGTKMKQGNLWLDDCDRCNATMAVSSGKWYWEARLHHQHHGGQSIGINEVGNNIKVANWANDGNDFHVSHPVGSGVQASIYVDGTDTSSTGEVGTVADGQLLGFMVDVDAQTITVHCDDAEIDSDLTDYDYSACNNMETITPSFNIPGGRIAIANFGQDSSFAGQETSGSANATDSNGYGDFYYEPPADYLALCTKNLPDATVTPSEHFNTILYDDGAGAKTGVGFQPDMVWLKSRGSAYSHKVVDVLRGVGEGWMPDVAGGYSTEATGLTAFGADGFTVGADTDYSDTTGDGMVAWCWKAGGSGSANTDGNVASTVSANTDIGFSIYTWTGDGEGDASDPKATLGHGLNSAPLIEITQPITDNYGNEIGYTVVDGSYDQMNISANSGNSNRNHLAPTSSVIYLRGGSMNNADTKEYVGYSFHNVEGMTKCGMYTGNNEDDGTFVNLGFRPAWLMVKNTHGWGGQWVIHDSVRSPYNPSQKVLLADRDYDEDTTTDYRIDLLSNGFKCRDNDNDINIVDGGSNYYIYLAFAETPFKYANAR
jgi:hypothetical protein